MQDGAADERKRMSRPTPIDLIAVAALAGAIAVTAAEVGAREVLHVGLQSADEVAGYMLILIAFFGLNRALDAQGSYSLDVVFRRLPAMWQRRIALASACANVLVLAAFTISFAYLSWTSYRIGATSATLLAVPQALPQAVCAVALVAATSKALVLLIGRWKRRSP